MTTNIIGTVPFAGDLLLRLIGARTGNRRRNVFAILCSSTQWFCPAVTIALIAVHIYPRAPPRHYRTRRLRQGRLSDFIRSRRFGILSRYSSASRFYSQLRLYWKFRWSGLADPTDTTYVPRPEWYFLFLFQLLRMFRGSLEPLGTVVLPTLGSSRALCRSIYRSHSDGDRKEPYLGDGNGDPGVYGLGSTTGAAVLSSPPGSSSLLAAVPATEWAQFPAEQIAGLGYFHSARCDTCHNLVAGEPKPGPNLTTAQVHHARPWLIEHFSNPGQLLPQCQSRSDTLLATPTERLVAVHRESDARHSIEIGRRSSQCHRGCADIRCERVRKLPQGEWGRRRHWSVRSTASRTAARQQWVKAHFLSPQKVVTWIDHAALPFFLR